MKTLKEFLLESDSFVFAWNQATGKQKQQRPIPSYFRRFTKISSKRPPAGMPRSCYANALQNYQQHGWPIVVGFAMPKQDAERIIKTKEVHPVNALYRGYRHAWNLDREGAIIDSTYRDDAPNYFYYGVVVPDVSAKSFRNDSDVQGFVRHHDNVFGSPRDRKWESDMMQYTGNARKYQIEGPPSAKIDQALKAKGYRYHSVHGSDKIKTTYLYISQKGNKLYVSVYHKTGEAGELSVIPYGKYGEGVMKTWATMEDWLNGNRPVRRG